MKSQMHLLEQDKDTPSLNAVSILRHPEALTPEFVGMIIDKHDALEIDSLEAAVLLGTIVMMVPELGSCVPVSFLERLRKLDQHTTVWHHFARIMLHSSRGDETCNWLQIIDRDREGAAVPLSLIEHLCDWFPNRLQSGFLKDKEKRDGSSPQLTNLIAAELFRHGVNPIEGKAAIDLSLVLPADARVLVIHNIVDGQGDEIVRTHALLQALLDQFPALTLTVFADRLYLYDHPRVTTFSVSDTDVFLKMLQQPWHGVIDFFEPYLAQNSYNLAVQSALESYLRRQAVPLLIWANKDRNHFVYRSIKVQGKELAGSLDVNERRLPLTYETTMRLIHSLRLPLRTGEQKARAGAIQTTTGRLDLAQTWQELRERLTGDGSPRAVALVNIFGGQNPHKGFSPATFDRLACVLQSLVDEGYGVVMAANGESWGDVAAIEDVRGRMPERYREKVAPAPVIADRQENMRQLKYFAAWCDLIVAVEGWMMHLAYSLGKSYRLLMAPMSYGSEWHPHGRSASQQRWLPPDHRRVRDELKLPRCDDSVKPVPVHYPEKALLESGFALWACTRDRALGEVLSYWMSSDDRDIKQWLIAALSKIDGGSFITQFLSALNDGNHEVRAAAATALLASPEKPAPDFSDRWREELLAYQYIGQFRFRDALALGKPALKALRACLSGDEIEVKRDAALVLEQMS